MAFQHHRGMRLTVRKLSCIDAGRIFVAPLRGEKTTSPGQVFQIEDVTTECDIIQVDMSRNEVYIYSSQ